MPDTPATPDVEALQPEVDELAKDVVGVPIRCWRCVVDDDGLHARRWFVGPRVDVPWRDVTAIYAEDFSLIVEGKRGDGGPRVLFDIYGSSGARAAVLAAWEEYTDRRLDRDGRLAGSWSKMMARSWIAFVYFSVFLLGIAVAIACKPPGPTTFYTGTGRIDKEYVRAQRTIHQVGVAIFALGGIALIAYKARRWRHSARSDCAGIGGR